MESKPDITQRYCSTVEEIEQLIQQHEKSTLSKYVSYRKDGKFGQQEFDAEDNTKHNVLWKSNSKTDQHSVKIEFDGIPYFVVGIKTMGCHRGRDKGKKHKAQVASERAQKMMQNPDLKPRRTSISKKINCPAKIHITQVVKFPEFKIDSSTTTKKEHTSKALRQKLKCEPYDIKWEMRYYYRLPAKEDHVGFPVCQEEPRPAHREPDKLDPVIEQKIIQMLHDGETDTDNILKQCRQYSKDVIFAGQKVSSRKENRSYFPVKTQVQKFVDRTMYGTEDSLSDEEDFIYMDNTSLADTDITRPMRRLRRENRCLLHQIFVSTYHINDDSILQQLKQNLQTLLLSLRKCFPDLQQLVPSLSKKRKAGSTPNKGGPSLKKHKTDTTDKPVTNSAANNADTLLQNHDGLSETVDSVTELSRSHTQDTNIKLLAKALPILSVQEIKVKKEKEEIERINRAVASITTETLSSHHAQQHIPTLSISQSNIEALCRAAEITPNIIEDVNATGANEVIYVVKPNEGRTLSDDGSSLVLDQQVAAETGVVYNNVSVDPGVQEFHIHLPATEQWSEQEVANLVNQVVKNECSKQTG